MRSSATLKSNKCSNGNLYNCVATSDVDSDRSCSGGGGGVASICCAGGGNTSSIYGNIADSSAHGSAHSGACMHTRQYPQMTTLTRLQDGTMGADSECSSRGDYAVPDIMQSTLHGGGGTSTYPHGHSTGLGSISASIANKPLPQTPSSQMQPLLWNTGCHSNAAPGSSAPFLPPYHHLGGGHMTTYLRPCPSSQGHMTSSQGHMLSPQGHHHQQQYHHSVTTTWRHHTLRRQIQRHDRLVTCDGT